VHPCPRPYDCLAYQKSDFDGALHGAYEVLTRASTLHTQPDTTAQSINNINA
jgi:hypothetical protein